MRSSAAGFARKAVMYVVLLAVALFTLLPFYWMLVSSLRPTSEIFDYPRIFSGKLTLENYARLFLQETSQDDSRFLTVAGFPRWYLNSTIVATTFTALFVVFASMGGYAFAKFNFAGKRALFFVALVSMTISYWTIAIPLFVWFTKIRLLNTYLALILPEAASAFGLFFLRQYIHGVPNELIDSGRIDGCSELGIYTRIVLPVITPALAAAAIWGFTYAWNDFLLPLIVVRSNEMMTIPPGLASFVGARLAKYPEYGLLMAGGVLSVIPMLAVFIAMQRQFVAGLTLGAVKS